MPSRLGPITLALATLAGPGCMPACEDEGLRAAMTAFEARTPAQRQVGLQHLGRACPSLPPVLAQSLRIDFELVDPDDPALAHPRHEDPAWNELSRRLCAARPPEQARSSPDYGAQIRAACNMERYGLFTADDQLLPRDFTVVMLYEWMTAGRVDPALARDVVRPLLSTTATPEELEPLCLLDGVPCPRLLEAWDLELPRSSSDAPLRAGTTLRLTPTQLLLESTPLLPLRAGAPEPGALAQHLGPALQKALAQQTRIARRQAVDPSLRFTLVADHATPMSTLGRTLLSATEAGFGEAQLVVRHDDRLAALPLHAPGPEPASEPEPTERPLLLTFLVRREDIEVGLGGLPPKPFPGQPCKASPARCHDLEAIAEHVRKLKELFPHEDTATFRFDDDVPLQAAVSLIDVVRGGEACTLLTTMMGEEPPAECLFHRAVLDPAPVPSRSSPTAAHDAPPAPE